MESRHVVEAALERTGQRHTVEQLMFSLVELDQGYATRLINDVELEKSLERRDALQLRMEFLRQDSILQRALKLIIQGNVLVLMNHMIPQLPSNLYGLVASGMNNACALFLCGMHIPLNQWFLEVVFQHSKQGTTKMSLLARATADLGHFLLNDLNNLLIYINRNLSQARAQLYQKMNLTVWLFKYKETRRRVQIANLGIWCKHRKRSSSIWHRWRNKYSDSCALVNDEGLVLQHTSLHVEWKILQNKNMNVSGIFKRRSLQWYLLRQVQGCETKRLSLQGNLVHPLTFIYLIIMFHNCHDGKTSGNELQKEANWNDAMQTRAEYDEECTRLMESAYSIKGAIANDVWRLLIYLGVQNRKFGANIETDISGHHSFRNQKLWVKHHCCLQEIPFVGFIGSKTCETEVLVLNQKMQRCRESELCVCLVGALVFVKLHEEFSHISQSFLKLKLRSIYSSLLRTHITHSEAGFRTQYNNLKQSIIKFQSSSGSCRIQILENKTSEMVSYVFHRWKIKAGRRKAVSGLMRLRLVVLTESPSALACLSIAPMVYSISKIGDLLKAPMFLLCFQWYPSVIKVILQWKEHPPDHVSLQVYLFSYP